MAVWLRLAELAAVSIGLAYASGCASDATDQKASQHDEAATGTNQSSLVGGTETTSHPEAGFVISGGSIAGVQNAGGVLIAPNLVITSMGVVVKSVFVPAGAPDGTCGTVSGSLDPSQVTFVLGDGAVSQTGYVQGQTAGATTRTAKQIVTNGKTSTCDTPFAFLVLDQPINGVNYPQIQIDHGPALNDPILQCGWGPTDTFCDYPSKLICGTGTVLLNNGGYYSPTQETFNPGEVVTTVSGCGDVGGPLYDNTGALLGLETHTVYNKDIADTLSEPCKSCGQSASSSLLIAPSTDLLIQAFAAIGSTPWRAGHPKPSDVGGTCTDSLDCNSQMCVQVGKASYCSQDCSTTACPSSTVCTAVDGKNVCLPAVTPHPASCTVGSASNADGKSGLNFFALFGLMMAGLVASRSRVWRKQ
jgi:hypothetical protein